MPCSETFFMDNARQGDEASKTQADDSSPERAPARKPFVQSVATVVTIVVVSGLLITLFVLGVKVLLAAFGGVLLAVFLRALTDAVKHHTPLTDGWALAVVILVLLIVLGGAGWLLGPQIADQASERLPTVVEDIRGFLEQYGWGQRILEQVQGGAGSEEAANNLGGFFSAFSEWSSYVLVAIFVGLFAAANPELYKTGIVHLFPLQHRDRVRALIEELGHTLRWWLVGQALTMLIIGVSTAIVLGVFGIPLAVALGVLVGLLSFVPYLGPIVGVVPVALIAATEGTMTLVYVILAYGAVELLESYVATPLIQQQTVYLPPAFTIISQILLGTVLGVLGVVFATPLAAVVLVLTRFYRTDILGDEEAEEEGLGGA